MHRELEAGKVKILIEKNESAMGQVSARLMAQALKDAANAGKKTVLWLMAAPSAFSFYRAFTELCKSDEDLAAVIRETLFYQFDDYPIDRDDPKFTITFRYLLEKNFFNPLRNICGSALSVNLLELKGDSQDDAVAAAYAESLCRLLEDPAWFVGELKGIGMDGHWGFHDSGVPFDAAPGIIRAPMTSLNIHQQRIDWPQYFKADDDVPKFAYSFTVAAFMKADYIIDNVPQCSKKYSVLATYGNDTVLGDIPSSALKNHPNAVAVLTRQSADVLEEYREARVQTKSSKLSRDMYQRLLSLWEDTANPIAERENTLKMETVLKKLKLL
jgi:6-phosphogluconolactonase/glucosamine-6-phosphate isomerase/deaminase